VGECHRHVAVLIKCREYY